MSSVLSGRLSNLWVSMSTWTTTDTTPTELVLPQNTGADEWAMRSSYNFNGVLSHIDAFGNDHWDVSVERVDKWCAYAKQWLGQGGGGVIPSPPVSTDEEDDEMMRWVLQVGGGGKHGSGTNWAISPTEPKAWPIANQYTVDVMRAHGVLMTKEQMMAKHWTFETDGGSITSTYAVQPVIESIPDQ